MPRKYSITYREVTSPVTELVTKFGGRPVWIDEPRWPLSREHGTPMQFICQIALSPELFGDIEPRMAYLFITDDLLQDYFVYTAEPDGGENAIILQPGGLWEGPSLPLRNGPTLYRAYSRSGGRWCAPAEFAVDLRSGDDPPDGTWDDRDPNDEAAWNAYFDALIEDKIGGTPVPTINTNPRARIGDNMRRLLLQLNTKENEGGDPFWLNFASDGVGYAFLSDDSRTAKFLWSR